MKKLILSLALGIGVAAIAGAQLNTTDRNFQRLDRSNTANHPNTKNETDQASSMLQVAGFFTFPNTVESYGGSVIYTSLPKGSKDGMGSWALTGTYTHMNPSGGDTSNWGTGTFNFQATTDQQYAVTPGVIYSYNMTNNNVLAPFLSFTVPLGTGLALTPTATYDRVMVPGDIQTGWVPDFMLAYSSSQNVAGSVIYVDYTTATRVNGTGALQAGLGVALDNKGHLGLKLAATMAKENTTVYAAEVVWKF